MERIAVVGLGYVGLPLALALGRAFRGVVGFDINEKKVADLKGGYDCTEELAPGALDATSVKFTSDVADMKDCTFFIVAVPTPVTSDNLPDLEPLEKASEIVGKVLKKGDVVVYESTVYPGVTRLHCKRVLEDVSGLDRFTDFKVGYSPERINPGDKEHQLETIVKIVSGEDLATLDRVANVYARVVPAGVHRAPSVEVAEAAKVIENIQRDVNIALMNELAMLFAEDSLISMKDVLAAAGTKWNFLKFTPGLVGGHCVGVDPYYLVDYARTHGRRMPLVETARTINENVPSHVVEKVIVELAKSGRLKARNLKARVGVLGYTFKENVKDARNSKVVRIVEELRECGMVVLVNDPLADCKYDPLAITGSDWKFAHDGEVNVDLMDMRQLDAVVVTVPHARYSEREPLEVQISQMLVDGGIVYDVKSALDRTKLRPDLRYFAL